MTVATTAECPRPSTLHRYRTREYAEIAARAASRYTGAPVQPDECACGLFHLTAPRLSSGNPRAGVTTKQRDPAPASSRDVATPCPDCGQSVLSAGRVTLDLDPHPHGVYWIDGTPMREAEWREVWSEKRPVGRRVHLCGRGAA